MNRIENERIKFYLEHETRIREWSDLEVEVGEFVDRFYRSLKGDLDEVLKSKGYADDDIKSFLVGGSWPGLGLRRRGWPTGDEDPSVRLEWRKQSSFPPHGVLICGVKANRQRYGGPFTAAARPSYPCQSPEWAAYKKVEPPDDRFWEGDNLMDYRSHLVRTIFQAWTDLAPLVDEAVGQ